MIDPSRIDNDIESHLVELHQAEQAGVFRATRLDARAVLRGAGAPSPSHMRLRWASAAAVLLVVGAVWAWMFNANLAELRQGRNAGSIADTRLASATAIGDCLVGPLSGLPSDCTSYDLDGDGDVDMADIGSYQIAYAQR